MNQLTWTEERGLAGTPSLKLDFCHLSQNLHGGEDGRRKDHRFDLGVSGVNEWMSRFR